MTETSPHTTEQKKPLLSKGKIIILIVVIVAVLGIGFFVWRQKSEKTITETVTDIRNLFKPEQLAQNNTASSTPPQGDIGTATSTTRTVAVAPPAQKPQRPRGSQVAGATTPVPVTNYTHTNHSLGIQLQLNTNWQALERTNSVVFTSRYGQEISIQVYNNVQDSLDTTFEQLARSSSATNVNRTTFLGLPAVTFQSGSQQGVAFMKGSRLYYIMAPSLTSDPASTFILI